MRLDDVPLETANDRAAAAFFRLMTERRVDDLALLFTPDGVQEQPYTFPGQSESLIGREAIRANYAMSIGRRREHRFDIHAWHRTTDPDCLIVEARGTSVLGETDEIYDNRYVAVFRFRDTLIAHLRFYFDPLVAQRVFSRIRGLG